MKRILPLLSVLTAVALTVACLPLLGSLAQTNPTVSIRFVDADGQAITEAKSDDVVTAQVVLSDSTDTLLGASLYVSAQNLDLSDVTLKESEFAQAECAASGGVLSVALYDGDGLVPTDGVLCAFDVTVGNDDPTLTLLATSGDVSGAVTAADETTLPVDGFGTSASLTLAEDDRWITGAQLVLNESVGINYYVPSSKLADYPNATVHVVYDTDRDGVDETVTLESGENVVLKGTSYCRFYFGGIAPDHFGTKVTADLILVPGQDAVESLSYAVSDYLTNMAGYHDGELDTLLADLLVYGQKTEAYTGISTLTLNSTLTALQAKASTEEVANTSSANQKKILYPSGLNEQTVAVAWTSVGLNLKDNAALLYTFMPTGDNTLSDYTLRIEFDGKTTDVALSDSMEHKTNGYVYRFRDLGPDDMKKVVKAYFVDSEGKVVSAYLRYSIESYAYYCRNNRTADANAQKLYELTQALLRYGNDVSALLS